MAETTRQARVLEVLLAALDRPAGERAEALESLCGGDAALRAAVEELLAGEDEASAFLRAAPEALRKLTALGAALEAAADGGSSALDAGDATRGSPQADERDDPSSIGPYAIVRVLGEGGMGTVYLAEQSEPVRRRVALKVIRPGMHTREVIARFNAERQALALMAHPCIATVFDAGTTEDGRPYFAMEYVDGVPITSYCDAERLELRARVELFVDVCGALEHAHERGIVHRDLKPSNVLVSREGGRARPRVIDFGIAKALDQRLTEASIATEVGRVVGTPSYMSPEQARAESPDVDARTDVFSLGVVLYELLTGELPFEWDLTKVSFDEIRRCVAFEEPPSPGTRFGRLSAARRDAIAQRRGTSAANLPRRLRGDLEWITMRALEKEPERRYPSASALAADLERHLRNVPVHAGPPSTVYRLKKFVRKHSIAVAAGGAILAALSIGLAVATFFAVLAGTRLEQVYRLSDMKDLADALAQMDSLWPARPSRIPQMEDWLGRARKLLERTEAHRRTLVDLGPERRSDSAETRWHREALADLVRGLDEFALDDAYGQTFDAMRYRLDAARELAELAESDAYRGAWDEALRSIANPEECPEYVGAELAELLRPQVDLLPIGRDRHSGLWEFAHTPSGEVPERDGDGALVLTEDSCIVLVLVPGGRFVMGAVASGDAELDGAAEPDERPAHEVRLTPFFVSKHEMTQGQWERFTGSNPSHIRAGDAEIAFDLGEDVTALFPVENVSWSDCVQTLERLGLALPTEAQWEYAARGGTTSPWWCGAEASALDGNENLADIAFGIYAQNDQVTHEAWDDGHRGTAAVGSYAANPFGLHDVSGNVSEWCADWYAADAYATSVEADPDGPAEGTYRVLRGGSWQRRAVKSRSSERDVRVPDYRSAIVGVRPARAIDIE